jgi:hypothetical protein
MLTIESLGEHDHWKFVRVLFSAYAEKEIEDLAVAGYAIGEICPPISSTRGPQYPNIASVSTITRNR